MGKLDKDRKDEAIPDDLKRIAVDYRGALAVFGQWGIRAQAEKNELADRMYLERRRDEMVRTASLAREIYETGFSPGNNGKRPAPWFGLDNTYPPEDAAGLAAYMPASEMIGGRSLTVFKLGRDTGNKSAWIIMTDEAIMIGTDQLIRSDDKRTYKPLFNQGMARPPDEALLAMQQIGIARWGKVRIAGGVNFVQRSIEIAAKNGIWQFIANPELQAKIHHLVRCESGADALWKMMTGNKFGKDASIHKINDALYARVSAMTACLKRELEDGSLRNSAQTEKDRISALVSNIEKFGNDGPGAFLDGVIKSSGPDANPGMDMRSLLKEAVKIVSADPKLKKAVENEAALRMSDGIVPDADMADDKKTPPREMSPPEEKSESKSADTPSEETIRMGM